jgi:hypothetical protein
MILEGSEVPFKPTARDLLVYVAGNEHAEHTIMSKTRAYRAIAKGSYVGAIKFKCSCGAKCAVLATEPRVQALRNVDEGT